MNVVCMTARLTRDPEIKHTQSGVAVCSFSGAVDRTFQTKGQDRVCDFVNFVSWRNNAEFIGNHFHKGDMIAVSGELQSREYTDKEGNKHTVWEVIISNAGFCGSKKQGGVNIESDMPVPPSVAQTEQAAPDGYMEISDGDELPF